MLSSPTPRTASVAVSSLRHLTKEASHERLPTFRIRDERRIEFSPLGSLRDDFVVDVAESEALCNGSAYGRTAGARCV